MDEKIPPIRKGPASEPASMEAMNAVKDSWYRAYKEANIKMPQILMAINIYLINELLNDPDVDFEAFARSELTTEQKKDLGRAMSIMHAHEGIKHSTPEESYRFNPGDGVAHVPDVRMASLWTHPRGRIISSLASLLSDSPNISLATLSYRAKGLNAFFRDPKNSEDILLLKNSVGAMKRSLKSKEMAPLLVVYKDSLKGANSIRPLPLIKKNLSELTRKDLEEKGIDTSSPMYSRIATHFFDV